MNTMDERDNGPRMLVYSMLIGAAIWGLVGFVIWFALAVRA